MGWGDDNKKLKQHMKQSSILPLKSKIVAKMADIKIHDLKSIAWRPIQSPGAQLKLMDMQCNNIQDSTK